MDDRRVAEDYLPVEAISAETAREERTPNRKGHMATLHLWWARRPRETGGRGNAKHSPVE